MCSGIFVKLNFLAFGLRFVGILKSWLIVKTQLIVLIMNIEMKIISFVYTGNVFFIFQTQAYLQCELIYAKASRYYKHT